MKSVLKREFGGFFRSFTAGITIFVCMLAVGIGLIVSCVNTGSHTFQSAAQYICLLFIPGIPLLLMNMFSKEHKYGTDRLLLSSPIKIGKIVVGKYLATALLLCVSFALSALLIVAFCFITEAPLMANLTILIGLFALSIFLAAAQTLVSSVSPNALIALIAGILVMLFFRYMSDISVWMREGNRVGMIILLVSVFLMALLGSRNFLLSLAITFVVELPLLIGNFAKTSAITTAYSNFLNKISPFARFTGFLNGILDIEALVYFVTVSILLVTIAAFAAGSKNGGMRRKIVK